MHTTNATTTTAETATTATTTAETATTTTEETGLSVRQKQGLDSVAVGFVHVPKGVDNATVTDIVNNINKVAGSTLAAAGEYIYNVCSQMARVDKALLDTLGYKSVRAFGAAIGLKQSTAYQYHQAGLYYTDPECPEQLKRLTPSKIDALAGLTKEQIYQLARDGKLDGKSQSELRKLSEETKGGAQTGKVETMFMLMRGMARMGDDEYTLDGIKSKVAEIAKEQGAEVDKLPRNRWLLTASTDNNMSLTLYSAKPIDNKPAADLFAEYRKLRAMGISNGMALAMKRDGIIKGEIPAAGTPDYIPDTPDTTDDDADDAAD